MAEDLVDYLIAQDFIDAEENEEEENEGLVLRLERKLLRDTINPFDITDTYFINMYRLPKQAVHDLVNSLMPHLRPCRRSTSIPQWMRVSKIIIVTLNSPASFMPWLFAAAHLQQQLLVTALCTSHSSPDAVILCLVYARCRYT
jgi:hypothetical protein